jgi:ubiquinone/menaquinone biosynthesis C-methylase UbiE
MTPSAQRAAEIQRQYYADTSKRYESMHAHEGAADAFSAKLLQAIVRLVDARSVLDVGAGTGLSLRVLKDALPHVSVCGIEPVHELIQQAAPHGQAAPGPIIQARGEALPFSDGSFDVVCEFAMLHHVPNPEAVVREMLRVARKAIFISDSNRFGQGSLIHRMVKLLLFKARLWGVFSYLRTFGKGFLFSEGDGVFYSYSVYDSFQQIACWGDRLILIPNGEQKVRSWLHPLLTSGGVILCALRERK